MRKSISIFILLILFCTKIFSQSAMNIEFFALGYHPFKNPNYEIYENSLSSDGTWVVEPGLILSYQKFIRLTHTSLQINQGIFSDAAAQFAGYTGLALKRKFFHKYKHSFSFAIGAAYLYRSNWHNISRYVPEYDFTESRNNKFESKFSYTYELKYYFYVGKIDGLSRSDLSLAVLYGQQFCCYEEMD